MNKHTPEPWRCEAYVEGDEVRWWYVRDLPEGQMGWPLAKGIVCEADARRIVACVNACAGLSTEALENGALRDLVEAARRTGFLDAAVAKKDEKKKRSAHTPGPWVAVTPDRDNPSRAMVSASGGADIYSAPLTRETEANARLIAAAPDLLDALAGLVETIDSLGTQRGEKMDRARTALAKARGES